MGLTTKLLFGLTLASGAATAERVADPFDRHEHNYSLEGPAAFSEVMYVSVNWQDTSGEKHDDRIGDMLLITTIASGLGAIATRVNLRSLNTPAPTNNNA